MAIRDKIRDKAQSQLRPGEQIQEVFAAQTASQYLALLGWIVFLIVNNYRSIVVTDQRIVVFDSGKWAQGSPKEIVRELPRGTRVGPAQGLWYATGALGEDLRIHKRFHKDIEAADAQASGAPAA
ncbi:hypothetical protein [Iamia sp.]|uniref:hypothetical protein n=1 Tax=Iamia sp. TaxID=2722710 RepID=UPI002C86FB72|nr:hypothetical protein [Iamia sp.]HXH57899.1 hypothetical protein [Iamia sp.]